MAMNQIGALSGPQRAAVVMMAMGEGRIAQLFALMDDKEIQVISQTMASLGSVEADVVEQLCGDFEAAVAALSAAAEVGRHG